MVKARAFALLALGASSAAAQEWKPGPVSAGYRFTGGSGSYWAHAFEGRAVMSVDTRTDAYTRFDYTIDKVHRWSFSWTLGGQQDLGGDWQGRTGLGYSRGEYKAGGDSVGSFLVEAAGGHPIGDWWGDLEYRLTAGRVARVFSTPSLDRSGGGSGRKASALAVPSRRNSGPGSSVATAGAAAASTFTQHDITAYLGGALPVEGLNGGLSATYWTRDGASGWSASIDGSYPLSDAWSLSTVATLDLPSGADSGVFLSAGLRYGFTPVEE